MGTRKDQLDVLIYFEVKRIRKEVNLARERLGLPAKRYQKPTI